MSNPSGGQSKIISNSDRLNNIYSDSSSNNNNKNYHQASKNKPKSNNSNNEFNLKSTSNKINFFCSFLNFLTYAIFKSQSVFFLSVS